MTRITLEQMKDEFHLRILQACEALLEYAKQKDVSNMSKHRMRLNTHLDALEGIKSIETDIELYEAFESLDEQATEARRKDEGCP